MKENTIEISLPIEVAASLSFHIDANEWRSADNDTRRAIIAAQADIAQRAIDNGNASSGIYLLIKEWNPDDLEEYSGD